MPRTVRNPVTPSFAGTTVAFTAVDNVNGESFAHAGGRNKLLVTNGSGASINVTVKRNYTSPDGGILPDNIIAIPAAATKAILEAPTNLQIDGNVYVDYSAGATVTAMLVQG